MGFTFSAFNSGSSGGSSEVTKAYVDGRDMSTLATAQNYTDNKSIETLAIAQTYSDNRVSTSFAKVEGTIINNNTLQLDFKNDKDIKVDGIGVNFNSITKNI